MKKTGLNETDLANATINNRNNALHNPGAHLKLKHNLFYKNLFQYYSLPQFAYLFLQFY